jgi:phage replication O-like protein O
MVADNHAISPGFQFPNTTQIPNEVFDSLMSHLSGGELKVLLYICRRTFGFQKESDRISLSQISKGIITKTGKVLDSGTGLCKRQVINALKTLEKKNIISITRTVDETGLNAINTYRLNMVAAGCTAETPVHHGVANTSAPGVVNAGSPGVVHSSAPTKQREQKKEEQKKDTVVDVVAQDLENFGIAKSAITKLLQNYPMQHIREKLEMAKGLVAAGSGLVSQNPAGWLRRAIEEDYTLPKTTERHWQRSDRKKKHATLTQAKAKEQHTPEVRSQPVQNVATKPVQCPQNVVTPEKKEAEKTDRENQATWDKTVEQVTKDLPPGETADRLAGTALLAVTETAATIFVPNRTAIPWLERRLYGQLTKAMKGVLGKDLDLQFIAAS